MTQDLSDINHGNYERIACLVFCVITPIFLFTRLLSRILSKQLGSDDWAAVGACVFALSCNIQTLVALAHGWGRHKSNLTAKQLQICLLLHWTFQITYKITVALNKISILLLYLRIMPQRFYRISCYTLLTLVSLFAVATTIAGVFQCVPVEKAWIKAKKGHCYNLVDAWYSNAVFSIVTDFLILFLPMHMVYKLQRAKQEKWLLYAVFGVGIFVTFTSIMRFFALKAANNPDTTYDVNSGFWSVIEINVGVICVCLPPLRALLSRQFPVLNFGIQSGPYPRQYVSTDPSAQKSQKSGNSSSRNPTRQSRGVPLESEEELVYFTGENSTPLKDNNGIMKMTEFTVSDRSASDGDIEQAHVHLKPWERQMR